VRGARPRDRNVGEHPCGTDRSQRLLRCEGRMRARRARGACRRKRRERIFV
jgi:hypothetical protein